VAKSFCPVCGRESGDQAPGTAEAALCSTRCNAAFEALAALRRRESESEPLAARRQQEQAARAPHAPALSELLLRRWRAGDWTVDPDRVIAGL